jgi:NAD(P)-dependent dehydrogenase (short-subunit alcohol dehydrogenase family)
MSTKGGLYMAAIFESSEATLATMPPQSQPELLGIKMFDLTDRVAVVTGAGRGLGRSMAMALAAAGADVVVSSRTYPELEVLRDELRDLGPRAEAITADCTDESSCEHLVTSAIERMGKVDILVNNAGINVRKPILELSAEEFDRVLTTNLYGYFYCARAVGRHMVERGSGKVINISSMMGRVALPTQGAYASSKGAVEQLTNVLALEWAQSGVQVNAIAPAYCETPLTRPVFDDPERNRFIRERTPMGRWGQPHELAGAVIFLASDASSFVTGHTLRVDGGWNAW